MKKFATLAATAAILAASGAHAATTLKIACYLPPFSVSVSKILKPFAGEVTKATGGSVKFQEFWGGSLGRSPEQQYKLVTGGITDIVFISTYNTSRPVPRCRDHRAARAHPVLDRGLARLLALLQDGHDARVRRHQDRLGLHAERQPAPRPQADQDDRRREGAEVRVVRPEHRGVHQAGGRRAGLHARDGARPGADQRRDRRHDGRLGRLRDLQAAEPRPEPFRDPAGRRSAS